MQKEKQAPCREPNVGLDSRSPGSNPGPKAVLNCLATRAALNSNFNLVLDVFSFFADNFYLSIHLKECYYNSYFKVLV